MYNTSEHLTHFCILLFIRYLLYDLCTHHLFYFISIFIFIFIFLLFICYLFLIYLLFIHIALQLYRHFYYDDHCLFGHHT